MKHTSFLTCLLVSCLLLPVQAHPRCGMGSRKGCAPQGISNMFFSDATSCRSCHTQLWDWTGLYISIGNDWSSSMMAHAGRDPLWLAKVESEVMRTPAQKAQIEEQCARCHTPMARTSAVFMGQPVQITKQGFMDGNHPLNGLAVDGVSCTLCHQIQASGLGAQDTFSGNYRIDPKSRRPARLMFGPYAQPLAMPMMHMAGFTPAFGSHVRTSELCGTCHTLFVPYVDRQGKILGETPEQTPYLEWRHSNFADPVTGRSCQSCHLPEAPGRAVIASMPHHLPARSPFGQHHFVGGNSLMLGLIRDNRAAIGTPVSEALLDRTIARTLDQLRLRTAALAVQNVKRGDGTVEFGVRVTNLAGHKLPTGFPLRRVWLHVTAIDATGKTVFESGRPLPDGSIRGNDADLDPATAEPHHQTIESPDQVQIYEAVMADTAGEITYTLLHAAGHFKENRLLPSGFVKESAPRDVRPHGDVLTDADFIGGSDTVRYRFPLDASAGTLTVRVRVLFQPLSVPFMQDLLKLKGQNQAVGRLSGYLSRVDMAPVVLAAAEIRI